MSLKTYYDSLGPGEKKRLSQQMRISMSYLSQMITGDASISPKRYVQFEKFSHGAVKRREVKPDWKEIWPELAVLPLDYYCKEIDQAKL